MEKCGGLGCNGHGNRSNSRSISRYTQYKLGKPRNHGVGDSRPFFRRVVSPDAEASKHLAPDDVGVREELKMGGFI